MILSVRQICVRSWDDVRYAVRVLRRARNRTVLLFSALAVLAAGGSLAEPVRLTLLATTDLHGAVAEGVEDAESGRTLGGGSALAAAVERERQKDAEATLLFDVGDSMQGTALSNLTRGRPVIDLLNLLGVDAAVVGNHGFDWGVENFVERLGQASFPILVANLVEKATDRAPDWARPYHVLERRGLHIAVVGLLTQTTPQETVPKNVESYRFLDPAATAVRLVGELVPQKADLVVLLCHFGLSVDDVYGTELKDMAAALEGFRDRVAILAGHTHELHAEKLRGIVMAQPGSNGQYLGRIDLAFDPSEGRIVESETSLVPVVADGVPANPRVEEIVERYRRQVDQIMAEELGEAGVELDRDPSRECRLGNLLTDVIREEHGVDFAFQNSLGLRASIAAGTVRYEDVYRALPFDNTVVLMSLKGSEIVEMLAQADANNRLLYTSGLSYALDFSRPSGERVEVLSDLDPNRVYRVAVNNYMAQGGIGLSRLVEIGGGTDTGDVLRDVLSRRFRRERLAGRAVRAELDGRIVITGRAKE